MSLSLPPTELCRHPLRLNPGRRAVSASQNGMPVVFGMLESIDPKFLGLLARAMEAIVPKLKILLLPFVLVAMATHAGQQSERQKPIVLDENQWVTFYDLPSRRFRTIRTAVLTRNFEAAARDLAVTANYLSVEADRSPDVLQGPMREVVERLHRMEASVDKVTLEELDSQFGRAHWLLSQHYLVFARAARDARQARNTSLYLTATTHHMERAMLWSNVAVDDEVHDTLEDLRETAGELLNQETAAAAFRERPIVRAEQLLRKIGEQIDRRVLVPATP